MKGKQMASNRIRQTAVQQMKVSKCRSKPKFRHLMMNWRFIVSMLENCMTTTLKLPLDARKSGKKFACQNQSSIGANKSTTLFCASIETSLQRLAQTIKCKSQSLLGQFTATRQHILPSKNVIFGIVDHRDGHSTIFIFDETLGPKYRSHHVADDPLHQKQWNVFFLTTLEAPTRMHVS